jgi:hypothetical protein
MPIADPGFCFGALGPLHFVALAAPAAGVAAGLFLGARRGSPSGA